MALDMQRYLYRFLCCISNHGDRYMASVVITREERGRMIAQQSNTIQRLDEENYKVVSQSGNGMYDVIRSAKFAMRWVCNCPDWTYRQVKCKHIWAVEFSAALRNRVKQNVVIEPLSPSVCPYCTSTKLVHHGLRHNKYGGLQRFTCRACGKRFTQNLGFEHMGANPQSITSDAALLYRWIATKCTEVSQTSRCRCSLYDRLSLDQEIRRNHGTLPRPNPTPSR